METEVEDFDVIEASDERNVRIVRTILLFAFLVIMIVAVYTTVLLFGMQKEEPVSLSPPDAAQFTLPEDDVPATSFDIEKKSAPDEFSKEEKVYKDEEIQPSEKRVVPSLNPLIIYDEEDYRQSRIVWIVILLEVVGLFALYWQIDRWFRRKR